MTHIQNTNIKTYTKSKETEIRGEEQIQRQIIAKLKKRQITHNDTHNDTYSNTQ